MRWLEGFKQRSWGFDLVFLNTLALCLESSLGIRMKAGRPIRRLV